MRVVAVSQVLADAVPECECDKDKQHGAVEDVLFLAARSEAGSDESQGGRQEKRVGYAADNKESDCEGEIGGGGAASVANGLCV